MHYRRDAAVRLDISLEMATRHGIPSHLSEAEITAIEQDPPAWLVQSRASRTGTAYGGGVEQASPTSSVVNFVNASAVTGKAEYLHYECGNESARIVGAGGTVFNANARVSGNIVRAGLNYELNFAPAPVVARY